MFWFILSFYCILYQAFCCGSESAVNIPQAIEDFLANDEEIRPYLANEKRKENLKSLLGQSLVAENESPEVGTSLPEDKNTRLAIRSINAQLILDPAIQAKEGRQLIESLQDGSQQKPVLFVINYSGKGADPTINKSPVGLVNPDNRCYLNAALQILSPLYPLFQQAFAQSEAKIVAASLTSSFHILLDAMNAKSQEDDAVDPEPFEELVHRQIFEAKHETRPQRDSNEFINKFLTNSLFEVYPPLANLFKITTGVRYDDDLYEAKIEPPHTTCDLELIRDQGDHFPHSIEELLDKRFLKPQTFESVFIKHERIIYTGSYAMITLKRNIYDAQLERTIRLNSPTPFPLVGLHLGDYCEPKNPDMPQYELLGVIMHSGSATGGHYVAYVRGIVAGKPQWFLCNDSSVSQISDLEMTRIAHRGYGSYQGFLPTTFLYKRIDEGLNPQPAAPVIENSNHAEANAAIAHDESNAVFLIASVKDGVCQVKTENLEDKPAHIQELAQSVKTLLQERPVKVSTCDDETNDDPDKSQSILSDSKLVAGLIVAILAVVYDFTREKEKSSDKPGESQLLLDSWFKKRSKNANNGTHTKPAPCNLEISKLLLDSWFKNRPNSEK